MYRGFTYSFMKVTSRHSFTLFRPLSWKKPLFRGGPESFRRRSEMNEASRVKFVNSFIFALSVIFTQTIFRLRCSLYSPLLEAKLQDMFVVAAEERKPRPDFGRISKCLRRTASTRICILPIAFKSCQGSRLPVRTKGVSHQMWCKPRAIHKRSKTTSAIHSGGAE